jgi:hypothetical protein
MSDTVLTVNFINYSSIQWNLDQWGSTTESGVSGITQQPSPSMEPNAGQTTFQYQQDMAGVLADGVAGIWCCWNNGTSRIGVKLWAPLQMFGIGSSPFWYYMSDTDPESANINWVCNDNRAQQYTWPASLGYNIVAVPNSQSSALTLNVTFQDA